MLAQCQAQASYLQAALIFSLMTTAISIGAAALVIALAVNDRARRLIAPALRGLR